MISSSIAGGQGLKRPLGGTEASSQYSDDLESAQRYQQRMRRQALTPLSHALQPNLPASEVIFESQQQQQTSDVQKKVAKQQKQPVDSEVVVQRGGRRKASGPNSAKARPAGKTTIDDKLEKLVSAWLLCCCNIPSQLISSNEQFAEQNMVICRNLVSLGRGSSTG